MRDFSWSDYGPKNGHPVFVMHGVPGSRFEHPHDLSVCDETHSRLIVVERPGYGASKFDNQRTLADISTQVSLIADELELADFSVLGFSAGGPYALACAAQMPERVKKVALVGSLAPLDQPGNLEALPETNQGLYQLAASDYQTAAVNMAKLLDGVDALVNFFIASASDPDKSQFADSQFSKMYRQNLATGLTEGFNGTAYDMGVLARPWEFNPADLKSEVQLWHGEQDLVVPLKMSQYLHSEIPNSSLTTIAGAGHWLLFSAYREILTKLIL